VLDEMTRSGVQGPTGFDLDWAVSADGNRISRVQLFGTITENSGYGIDDLVLTIGPPLLEATPSAVDFGDVWAIWDAAVEVVTLTNVGDEDVTLGDIDLSGDSSGYLSVLHAPASGTVLEPGDTAEVEVCFAPDEIGDFSGTLLVESDDPVGPTLEVPLGGAGVDAGLGASEMLEIILGLFEEYVDAGLLEGVGPGNSASKRLSALYNMLEIALGLVNEGDYDGALEQLEAALKKTDGVSKPPDFVTGEAASRLAFLIEVVIEELE
jgi:hypothetical protein